MSSIKKWKAKLGATLQIGDLVTLWNHKTGAGYSSVKVEDIIGYSHDDKRQDVAIADLFWFATRKRWEIVGQGILGDFASDEYHFDAEDIKKR